MDCRSFHHDAGGISWYCELRGRGEPIILIPSGEGDCASFQKTAIMLARQFSVLTFDTPGFSRTTAPVSLEEHCLPKLADQTAALLQSLALGPATLYGCSSGGRAVLDLVANHPKLVKNALVHEAALPSPAIDKLLGPLVLLDDEAIVATCEDMFANMMNENQRAWTALGKDYHERLSGNYVTWVRRYLSQGMGEPINPAQLRHRSITWTIGSKSEAGIFQSNTDLAADAGIAIGNLPCRHFPQVSIPNVLAEHIAAAAILQSN